LSDGLGRPLALLLTAGNINDIGVARALLQKVGPVRRLIADRGYDANHLRRFLADQQAEESATASNACGAASGTGAARHKIRQARPKLPQRFLPRASSLKYESKGIPMGSEL
jgi:transposase